MKIAAVVVTYNRLNLLKECIEAIRNQTSKVDEIIVVNNSSTDGTLEWLNEQNDLKIITQENLGGAGGFYTGIKTAYEKGHDWIWCMDDDVEPDFNCLSELIAVSKTIIEPISALTPVRYFENKLVNFECKIVNYSSALKSFDTLHISEMDLNKAYFEIRTIPFEGPLINSQAIESIGLPDKGYFIIGDDTDYSLRLNNYGKIFMVPYAKMTKKLMTDMHSFDWKTYYQLKNIIILDRKYGKNISVRFFRPILNLARYIKKYPKDFFSIKYKYFLKALLDGYLLKQGTVIKPGKF